MRTARPTWLPAALSVAAVLVVALAAFLLLRPDGTGPAAGPTGPSPSASPSAVSTDRPSPSPSLSPSAPAVPVGPTTGTTPTVPAPTSTGPAAAPEKPAGSQGPAPSVTRQGRGDPLFDSCEQAVEAGFGPYTQGIHPEYDNYDDPDGDGTACPSEP